MKDSILGKKRKGVALFGGGVLEQFGFAETVRRSTRSNAFEVIDMPVCQSNDRLWPFAKVPITSDQIAVILVESITDSEVARITKLMHALAPNAVILAMRDQSHTLRPMDWPPNLRGILNWNDIYDRLDAYLELISDGLEVFDPNLTDFTATPEVDHAKTQGSEDLAVIKSITQREEDVAKEICSGAPNRSIAAKLGISVNTVNTHVNSLIRKTGFTNRTEFAVWYLRVLK